MINVRFAHLDDAAQIEEMQKIFERIEFKKIANQKALAFHHLGLLDDQSANALTCVVSQALRHYRRHVK